MIGSGNYGNLKNKPGSDGSNLLSAKVKISSIISREIEDAVNSAGVGVGCTPKKHDITSNFPQWLRDRDSESNFIEFAQSYYDWLYCKGVSGSQYFVDSNDFLNLLNLDNVSLDVVKSFASSYAADFPRDKIGNLDGNQGVTKDNFIKFLDGIKDSFYSTKGSEISFRYFFNTLYGETLGSNDIDYPKKKIMRLSGGRYDGWPGGVSAGGTGSYESVSSLGGAYLGDNYVLQDNYFYQEYSYLTKVGIDDSYSDILLEVLHPAGLEPFFEQSFDTYEPIGGSGDISEGISENVEITRIGNYLPYQINATGDIAPCVGCSGNALSFAYFETARGICAPNYDDPAFNHPGWALAGETTETVGDIDKYALSFSGVTLGDFLVLESPSGVTNPNDGVTTCDFQTCPS
jgi:hypothetical protein